MQLGAAMLLFAISITVSALPAPMSSGSSMNWDIHDGGPLLSSWQSGLPDGLALNDLSIPGSHNSLAYNQTGKSVVPDISRTQFLDLRGQLEHGVRFLDIRMRHFKDAFVAHHGATYLHSNFGDVVRDLCEFLSGDGVGAREAVVVRLKRETGLWDFPSKNEQDWDMTLFDYFHTDRFGTKECLNKIWWRPTPRGEVEWPTLGELRGKIMILEDFRLGARPTSLRYGFQWGHRMHIQDEWRILGLGDRKLKMKAITAFWKKHVDSATPDGTGLVKPESAGKLLVNHASGSGALAWPVNVATGHKGLNRRVREWLSGGDGRGLGYLGIVVEDFVGEDDVMEVMKRNFGLGGKNDPLL
ncbi:MAG: hypothetical protein M1813_005143 [Trichoglossum hirsutum]|nr:MAG: hypothetical protein M1813_005143 [Trichoglossum hirsutum]